MVERRNSPKRESPPDSFIYTSYRDGVIDIFNQFHEEAERIYGDPLHGLTPRELQEELVKRIPKGGFAVEDLVSIFEGVSYGRVEPTREDFDRCRATVEFLLSLMGGSSLGEIRGGKPLEGQTSGGPVTLFLFLLLGGVVVIVLFVFQRRVESMIGELVRVFRSMWG